MKRLICLLLTFIAAGSPMLLLAQDKPGVKIISRSFYVDKKHKEGPANRLEQVDSNYAHNYDQASTARTWVYANAWIGDVEAWISGTQYVDFEVTGLPAGTSFVAKSVIARFKAFGLADAFGLGYSDTNYRIQIKTGLKDSLDTNWSKALRRETIFSKRDKETWESTDFAVTLAKAAGRALISQIPGAGDYLDVVLEVASTAWDAVEAEGKMAKRGWLRFFNVPLVAGKRYRIFLGVESQVKAAAILAGQRSIKIDFMGRAPFFARDTKDLKEWGFGIENIEVVFPESVLKTSGGKPAVKKSPPTPKADLYFSARPVLLKAEKIMDGNYRIIEGRPVDLQISVASRYQNADKVKVLVEIPGLSWKENVIMPEVPGGKSSTATVDLPEFSIKAGQVHSTYRIEATIDPAREIPNETRTNNKEAADLLVIPRYLQLKVKGITIEPKQTEYQVDKPVKLTGVIENASNVDLPAVGAGFYYNSGTREKVNLVAIEKKIIFLKRGEKAVVSCSWKAGKSAEHWTDVFFIADPDNAIKEEVENDAHHKASTSVIVK